MGRRGPKRDTKHKREPNGQLSRKPEDVLERILETEERDMRDALSVGLHARVRVHKVEPQHAKDQMAGSFLGRLRLSGRISAAQYEAGVTYQANAEDYARAMASQPRPRAVDMSSARGRPLSEEDEQRVRRIYARHELAMKAVMEKQIELRGSANLFGALETCIMRDVGLEHMVGDLRSSLNALAKHYGLTARRAA